jgi:hypothetical protein
MKVLQRRDIDWNWLVHSWQSNTHENPSRNSHRRVRSGGFLEFSILGQISSSKYSFNRATNIGLTTECTLLWPIPSMYNGRARDSCGRASNNLSEWLKGTIWSAVPCTKMVGDFIIGAQSIFGNLSPYTVHPVSNTIRYTDKKGACRMTPPTGPPFSASCDCALPAARWQLGPDPSDLPYKTMFCAGTSKSNLKNLYAESMSA